MKQKCFECSYYYHGECHRFPPQAMTYARGIFPAVWANGWCGEFAPAVTDNATEPQEDAKSAPVAPKASSATNEPSESETRGTGPKAAQQNESKPKRKYTRRKK